MRRGDGPAPADTALAASPPSRGWLPLLPVVLALLVPVLQPSTSAAQDAAEYFRQNCASCHTIGGGRLTGPDLKDVTVRRDHAWLLRYIPDPKSMIDAGDPVATQLFQEARGVLMPSLPTATASSSPRRAHR